MKTLSFLCALAAFSAAHAAPIFKYVEFKETMSFSIPTDEKKENAASGSAGGKIVLGNHLFSLDARGYLTLPKTKWSAFDGVSSFADALDLCNDARFGVGGTLNTPFPLAVKAGMLSFSRSVSRLNNPVPSATLNPLKKSFGFSAGIGSSLPTLTSAVKPRAVFASLSVPQKRWGIPLEAQFAVTEDDSAFASFSVSARAGAFVSVQSVVTAGRFLVCANNTTKKLLADTNAFFDEAELYAASWESAFRSPFLKANLFVGFHQTPFSGDFSPYAVWVRANARTAFRAVLLDLSYFSIPTFSVSPRPVPFIGGSATVCRTIEQLGVNPQVQFDLRNAAALRFGIHALIERKILNTRDGEPYTTLKWSAGLAYESRAFTAKLTAGATNTILDGSLLTEKTTPDAYYSVDASTSLTLKSVRASCSLGYDHYPPSLKTGNTKDSFSFAASASPGTARLLTLSGGYSATYKNGERSSSSMDASVTFKPKTTWVRVSLKCAVSVEH
ncbi:MAG: hypothetical protein J1E32_03335 [Treponema sp.]|nr:hypothetical protein [Treponema sp.]